MAHTMSCIFSYTETATPLNGPAVGDRPWLGGPTVVMLSAIDAPHAPSGQPCMVRGTIHGLRTCQSGGPIVGGGGPMHGSVTGLSAAMHCFR